VANIRTVVECAQAAADRDAAQMRFPRFEEAWEAWTWRIARGPDWGYAVPGYPNYYMFKSNPGFAHYGVPITTILYRIVDLNSVEITAIMQP
jgi:hypothetical protein